MLAFIFVLGLTIGTFCGALIVCVVASGSHGQEDEDEDFEKPRVGSAFEYSDGGLVKRWERPRLVK